MTKAEQARVTATAAMLAVAISLMSPQKEAAMRVDIKNVDFKTGTGFNVAAFIIIASLAALY